MLYMDGTFTICSSVRIKHLQDNKIKPIVVKRVCNFPNKSTLEDVLQDVADHEDTGQRKTDYIVVSVADKASGGEVFEPYLDEEIRVVQYKSLKVTFTIMRQEGESRARYKQHSFTKKCI